MRVGRFDEPALAIGGHPAPRQIADRRPCDAANSRELASGFVSIHPLEFRSESSNDVGRRCIGAVGRDSSRCLTLSNVPLPTVEHSSEHPWLASSPNRWVAANREARPLSRSSQQSIRKIGSVIRVRGRAVISRTSPRHPPVLSDLTGGDFRKPHPTGSPDLINVWCRQTLLVRGSTATLARPVLSGIAKASRPSEPDRTRTLPGQQRRNHRVALVRIASLSSIAHVDRRNGLPMLGIMQRSSVTQA